MKNAHNCVVCGTSISDRHFNAKYCFDHDAVARQVSNAKYRQRWRKKIKASVDRYLKRNKEKISAKNKARWWANVDESRRKAAEYQRRRHAADPQRFRDYQKQQRIAHPERYKAYNRKYGLKNRDKARELSKLWRLANPERVKENNRKRSLNPANRQRQREYYQKHKERRRADSRKYAAKLSMLLKAMRVLDINLEEIT